MSRSKAEKRSDSKASKKWTRSGASSETLGGSATGKRTASSMASTKSTSDPIREMLSAMFRTLDYVDEIMRNPKGSVHKPTVLQSIRQAREQVDKYWRMHTRI